MRLLTLVVTTVLVLAGNTLAAAHEIDTAPAREYAKVTFNTPVKVGDAVLMGTYIIEHDNERMAAGGPCTHVYKFDDRRVPVAVFHCVHLNRPLNSDSKARVTVRRIPDMSTRIFELVEFQFARSADAHGVPDGR